MNKILAKQKSRYEHKQRVEAIDVCNKKEIFMSFRLTKSGLLWKIKNFIKF